MSSQPEPVAVPISEWPVWIARYIGHLVRAVVRAFIDDGCLQRAASLTYTSLFAVVPVMAVTWTIFSVLPAFQGVGGQIETFVFDNFVPARGAVVHEQLIVFSQHARNLTFVGVAILLLTAYLTLVTIEAAFNQIWRVPRSRSGVRRLLVYWTMMTCGPPMVGVTVLVSSYVLSLPLVSEVDVLNIKGNLISWLPWLTSGAAFFLLFWAVPNCRVVAHHAVIGAIVTMVAFQVAMLIFRQVVSNTNMEVIYGGFAAVPLFLSWLYVSWAIVLGGAVLVRQLGNPARAGCSRPPLEIALRILQRLHGAWGTGGSLPQRDLVAASAGADLNTVRSVTDRLCDHHYVTETAAEGLVLKRDLRQTSLLDLYLLFPQDIQDAELPDLPAVQRQIDELLSGLHRDATVPLDDLFANRPEPHDEPSEETHENPGTAADGGVVDGGVRSISS